MAPTQAKEKNCLARGRAPAFIAHPIASSLRTTNPFVGPDETVPLKGIRPLTEGHRERIQEPKDYLRPMSFRATTTRWISFVPS